MRKILPEAIADPQVHVELWHSLASLLRSYTAMHGLHHGRQAVTEADAHRIEVRHGEKRLELHRTGAAIAWKRENGKTGALELTLEGRLRQPGAGDAGSAQEMDMAAEAWARELMS